MKTYLFMPLSPFFVLFPFYYTANSIIFKSKRCYVCRKAEGACLAATSIRQVGWKIAFYLLDKLAYDLEPMAPAAGHYRKAENA
jgi:hypothetical protein